MGEDQQALAQPLVWVDLEMTGLRAERDRIVEVAVIVTDGSLERVVEGPELVLATPAEALEGMADVVREMHERSGLLAAIAESSISVEQAEKEVLEFVRTHVPDAQCAPLAGNTVHADRAFLHRWMPTVDAYLHYRHVDVSTIKELARRWRPEVLESAPTKGGGHRALADIRESIEELRYYRRALFR